MSYASRKKSTTSVLILIVLMLSMAYIILPALLHASGFLILAIVTSLVLGVAVGFFAFNALLAMFWLAASRLFGKSRSYGPGTSADFVNAIFGAIAYPLIGALLLLMSFWWHITIAAVITLPLFISMLLEQREVLREQRRGVNPAADLTMPQEKCVTEKYPPLRKATQHIYEDLP